MQSTTIPNPYASILENRYFSRANTEGPRLQSSDVKAIERVGQNEAVTFDLNTPTTYYLGGYTEIMNLQFPYILSAGTWQVQSATRFREYTTANNETITESNEIVQGQNLTNGGSMLNLERKTDLAEERFGYLTLGCRDKILQDIVDDVKTLGVSLDQYLQYQGSGSEAIQVSPGCGITQGEHRFHYVYTNRNAQGQVTNWALTSMPLK